MSFDADLDRWIRKVHADYGATVPAIGAAVLESIQHGSAVTGAPGQPVGQYGPGYNQGEVGGALLASFQQTFPAPDVTAILTKNPYARNNETGITEDGRPYVQRSTVGGRWSVAMTRVHFQRLVDHVVNAGVRPEGWTDNSALGGQ